MGLSHPEIRYNQFRDNGSGDVHSGGAIYATTEPEDWGFDNTLLSSSRCEDIDELDFSYNLYNSNEAIGGFQWTVDGTTATSATGGDAAAAGFTVQAAGSTVLGFSFTGSSIPAGCGTLVNLDLAGEATGLSGISRVCPRKTTC